ncbi:hypothetical protein ES706_01596 [subsurface metagenome]
MNLLPKRWLISLIALTAIAITVCGCGLISDSPVITSLEADKTVLLPSAETYVRCNATAVDGGNLSYVWTSNGGPVHARGGGESARWVAPDEPGEYTIMVNVTDEEGNEASSSIILTVRVNHLPVITGLVASEEKVLPLGSCQLECDAEDADNDPLTYKWEVEGGNITGEGSIVNWTAPEQPGSYNITVLVEDVMGGKSTTLVTIDVGVNHPPVIERLTAEKAKILKNKSCNIECVASDPDGDELSYSWSVERGGISGSGAKVKWTAPDASGQFPIMVTVSDGRGGVASEEVLIKVVTCLPCG